MLRLLPPLSLLFTAACGLPAESDLHGVWVNLDRGTLRVFEFANGLDEVDGGPAYNLYLYPSGTTAERVQSGTYATERAPVDETGDERPALVTAVQWSNDPSQIDQTYGNEFLDYEADTQFTLASPSGPNGERRYTWSEVIP